MAVDAKGNIYVAGYTAGGLPLDSAYQSTNGGGYNEGFFAKISGPAGPPTLAGAVNAESGSPTIAPNTWVEIGGSNLAPAGDTRVWQPSDFQSGNMPTQLNGVRFLVHYEEPLFANVFHDAAGGLARVHPRHQPDVQRGGGGGRDHVGRLVARAGTGRS